MLPSTDRAAACRPSWPLVAMITAAPKRRITPLKIYNRTGFSVLLVAIFHASFDASISQLSRDVVPASNTVRFLIFSAVIVLFATAVIIATKGQLGRRAAAPARKEGDAAGEAPPDDAAGREDPRRSDPRDA